MDNCMDYKRRIPSVLHTSDHTVSDCGRSSVVGNWTVNTAVVTAGCSIFSGLHQHLLSTIHHTPRPKGPEDLRMAEWSRHRDKKGKRMRGVTPSHATYCCGIQRTRNNSSIHPRAVVFQRRHHSRQIPWPQSSDDLPSLFGPVPLRRVQQGCACVCVRLPSASCTLWHPACRLPLLRRNAGEPNARIGGPVFQFWFHR